MRRKENTFNFYYILPGSTYKKMYVCTKTCKCPEKTQAWKDLRLLADKEGSKAYGAICLEDDYAFDYVNRDKVHPDTPKGY